jgi:predicted phosphoribosyltransferase
LVQKSEEVILQLKNLPPITDKQTIIVSAGIEMGMPNALNEIQQVKYAGSAKILMVN